MLEQRIKYGNGDWSEWKALPDGSPLSPLGDEEPGHVTVERLLTESRLFGQPFAKITLRNGMGRAQIRVAR